MSKLATRVGVPLALVAAGLFAVQPSGWDDDEDDGEPRSGSISCWWTPSRPAAIAWRFGTQTNGTASPPEATKGVPFVRTSKTLRVGDVVFLSVAWTGAVVGPGLLHSCTIKAGHTTKVLKKPNLVRISELVAVT